MSAITSPCNGICRIDSITGWCLGCRRTLDEITDWPHLGEAGRQAILLRLAGRKSAARKDQAAISTSRQAWRDPSSPRETR